MIEISHEIKKQIKDCQFAVSIADHVSTELYDELLSRFDCVRVDDSGSLMANSTAMMVASGTATIESAICNTPFLVVYKVSPLSYWIGKKLINVDHIAMANIVANQRLVPEFIQKDFCVDKVLPELLELMRNQGKREKIKTEFQKIRKKLGSPGASKRVAELASSMMDKNG